MVDELFTGALEAVGAFFEGEQGGIADENGGVGFLEHGVEVGCLGQERDGGVAPFVEEDAGVGEGGAAGCVGGYGAQSGERLRSAADEEQRANAGLGGDGAAGKDAKAGSGGEGGGGDQAIPFVGRASSRGGPRL